MPRALYTGTFFPLPSLLMPMPKQSSSPARTTPDAPGQRIWRGVKTVALLAALGTLAVYLVPQYRLDRARDRAIAIVSAYREDPEHLPDGASAELARAIALLKQVLHSRPDDANSYRWLGDAQRLLHDWDAAIAAYSQQLRIEPDNWAAIENLGAAFYKAQRYQDAENTLKKAARLEFAPYHLWQWLGAAQEAQEKWVESSTAYGKAAQMNPDDARLFLDLGHVFYKAKRSDDAVAALEKAVRLNPSQSRAYYWLGCAYYDQANYSSAIEAFTAARDKGDDDALPWLDAARRRLNQ